MKIEEKKPVTREENVFIKRTCDLCGASTNSAWSWINNAYKSDNISIERMCGDSYPEGDFRSKITLDMCPRCWCEKFVPWVENQNGRFSVVHNEDGRISNTRPDVECGDE